MLRADSGFYFEKIFELLESYDRPISYIIGCPMYVTIQCTIQSQKVWMHLDDGIKVAQTEYQSPAWDKNQTIDNGKKKGIKARPKAAGKVLRLFEDDEIITGCRHSCSITNLTLPPAETWRLYRNRAACENRIKELKYDSALDKINQQSFDATETTLNFVMIAFNLMNLFKQVVVKNKIRPTLKNSQI